MRIHQLVLSTSIWSLLSIGTFATPAPFDRSKAIRARQEDSANPDATACGAIYNDVNEGYAYHYASNAYACLTSVPFNAAVASRFIKYVNETIQFQSTLAYLKDPPTGYQQPAVDVLSELSKIQTNVTSNIYQNQYQFELDVQHLLYRAHDAHLYFRGGITAAFSFQAPYSITAASLDGNSLPKVYLTSDIIASRDGGGIPSAIKTINGEDVVDYLSKVASLNALGGIEPHADWNQLFDTPALHTQSLGSLWDTSVMFYPGDEIALVMEDGTEYLDYWLALWNEPYETGPLTTGGDFYNYFVLGLLPASYNRSQGIYNTAYEPLGPRTPPTPDNTWYNVTNKAYPDPDIRQAQLGVRTEGIVSGYFLPDTDAAVLSIPSLGQYADGVGNFSLAVSEFIEATLNASLSRVVIDLQQNRGGIVELAFSTFRRFFPEVEPFAGSRRRNHYLGDVLGEAYTAHFETLSPEDPDTQYNDTLADEWVITPRINAASSQNFTSWSQYHGSIEYNGDSLSLTERYNLSSFDYALALFDGWVPRGYTPEAPLDYSQPFKTENIVLLTDSACSSACALLVEMFTQVGVKTVVAGGRPSTGPMQALGGNRGALIYSADQIDGRLLNIENYVNATTYATIPEITASGFRDSGVFAASLAINLRDQIRPNDTIPLQFKYEAADCRIFYTISNVYNMSRLWRDTVTAAFDDTSLCVDGSTGYSNSTKPAPEPNFDTQYGVDLDFGEPDTALIGAGLDLSGGPQASPTGATSYTVTPCGTDNSCGGYTNKFCETVRVRPCNNPSGPLVDADACVPHTDGQSSCPPDTTWVEINTSIGRLNSVKPSKKSAGTASSNQIKEGGCYPKASFTDLCAIL